MNFFLVNQNPESDYNDLEGKYYNYPTSIPNGKQIKEGDILQFLLSSKYSKKLQLGERRIIGIAIVDNITLYNHFDKQMALASYSWYKDFKEVLSFEQIGGDPRINIQHSMNKISEDKKFDILARVLLYI